MIKSIAHVVSAFLLTAAFSAGALNLPAQPTSPEEPGSNSYPYKVFEKIVQVPNGTATLFGPTSIPTGKKIPVIVFGHGHDIPLLGYRRMCQHLAGKGIAVIFPDYSSGATGGHFDQYAVNYMQATAAILKQFPDQLDPNKVIFSGHSNGSYVALLAAGLSGQNMLVKPHAIVVFETAGFKPGDGRGIDPRTVVTIVVGDKDTNTPPSFSKKIFDNLSVTHKQIIVLSSYLQTTPQVIADHGAPRTFGVGPIETPLHWYGYWKFLVGAAWDLDQGGQMNNPYIYGNLAATTGIPGFSHLVQRN